MNRPICKDCALGERAERYWFCRRRETWSPVIGSFMQYDNCEMEREPFRFGLRLWSDRCGPEGRYFKEKVDG